MKKSYDYFNKYLGYLKDKDLYPNIYTVDGPSANPRVKVGGKEFLSFCSNNYLGLVTNNGVKETVKKAVDQYGIGSGSTRLLSGTLDIQIKFEKQLADFFGSDNAITFSSGYLANVGVIRMLVDPFPYFSSFFEPSGLIISDELNHASIIDGVRLAKAPRERFAHSNMRDLEKILSKNKKKRKLIISDGVFSMDGDKAKVGELVKLADTYDALLMIDDSHGLGVLGPHGEGVSHEQGVNKGVDIIMGSFTKAFGSLGGFITVNETLSKYLRITARSYIFSDPIPPALVAGLITQLELVKKGDDLRKSVLSKSEKLRSGLKNLGFKVLGGGTTIVPLLIGNEDKAIKFARGLAEKMILAPCIRRPAVIEGKERIRFSVMASHRVEDIDLLLDVCGPIGKSLKLI